MLKRKRYNLTYDLVARERSFIKRVTIENMRVEQNVDMKQENNLSKILNQQRNQIRMSKIWGQKAKNIKAQQSIVEWNIRQGSEIGNRITMRSIEDCDNLYKQMLIIAWPRKSPFADLPTSQGAPSLNKSSQKIVQNTIERSIGYRTYEELSGSYIRVNDWPMLESIEKNMGAALNSPTFTELPARSDIIEEAREMKMRITGLRWKLSINITPFQNNGLSPSFERPPLQKQQALKPLRGSVGRGDPSEALLLTFVRGYLKLPLPFTTA